MLSSCFDLLSLRTGLYSLLFRELCLLYMGSYGLPMEPLTPYVTKLTWSIFWSLWFGAVTLAYSLKKFFRPFSFSSSSIVCKMSCSKWLYASWFYFLSSSSLFITGFGVSTFTYYGFSRVDRTEKNWPLCSPFSTFTGLTKLWTTSNEGAFYLGRCFTCFDWPVLEFTTSCLLFKRL